MGRGRVNIFCTLHIRSNLHAALPCGFLRSANAINPEFVDNDSPDVRARRERVRKKLGLEDISLPRYHWRLSSDGFVDSDDIYDHLAWIFELIHPGRPLFQQLGQEFEFWISVFWEGNGTGGGPLFTLRVAELLVFHRVEMGVGFYLGAPSR